MSNQTVGRCIIYTCASERDNPFDQRMRPKEHAAWHDAYRSARLRHGNGLDECAFKDAATTAQEQIQFALIWRSSQRPFRLHANDVIRVDGRLGRVISVNDSAAIVLFNRPMRSFKTRFDKPVRFQQSATVVRISPNSETEILNRISRKQRRHAPPERRHA